VAVTAGAAKAHPIMVSRITGKERSCGNLLIVEAVAIRGTITI
jgi:hypothetical protein